MNTTTQSGEIDDSKFKVILFAVNAGMDITANNSNMTWLFPPPPTLLKPLCSPLNVLLRGF